MSWSATGWGNSTSKTSMQPQQAGATAPSTAAGGFGGFGASATQQAGATAPSTAAGGFGASATQQASPTSTTNNNSSQIASGINDCTLRGRTLGQIMKEWDDGISSDYHAFVNWVSVVQEWDACIIEEGDTLLELDATVQNLLSRQESLSQELSTIEGIQDHIKNDLEQLSIDVNTSYKRFMETPLSMMETEHNNERAQLYDDIGLLYDHVTRLETRVQDMVELNNSYMTASQGKESVSTLGALERILDNHLAVLEKLRSDADQLKFTRERAVDILESNYSH